MANRTLELILYVAKNSSRNTVYWVMKTIYFADKEHLLRFGRRIHDDSYIAMEAGPVPSYAYDLYKNVKFDRTTHPSYEVSAGQFETPDDRHIVPQRSPNLTHFSTSERLCLDEKIAELSELSFGELKALSHDDAWKAASTNGPMQIEDIIRAMDGGEEALPHLRERMLA